MLYESMVEFQFKEKRNYVQAPDIFEAVMEIARMYFARYPENLNGSFHRLLRSNGILRLFDSENDSQLNDSEVYSFFSISVNKKIYIIKLLGVDSRIKLSRRYDEDDVLKKAVLHDKVIAMPFSTGYTYMEQIVTMTKRLHLTIYPDAQGKWLATKIYMEYFFDPVLYDGKIITVKAMRNFHNRLTENSIFLDDAPVGSVYFSSTNWE